MSDVLLSVEGLSLRFAGVRALTDVSFDVRRGQLFSVIGPNGAGKSSLFNCISGVYRPTSGSIRFDGTELVGRAPHRIAKLGIARTFQNVEVFPTMTVLENLLLARHHHMRGGVPAGVLWFGRARREEVAARRAVDRTIDFLGLGDLRHRRVGSLPHGLQKRVELGRTLAMEPKLLLLDEPVAGMNHDETQEMVRAIVRARQELGIAVVLVEHDMGVVMEISEEICVLDFGERIALGAPADVARDEAVLTAYLGGAL
ncbi:ABC transporter ATP-binding protein [Micromonospora sp. NPDC023814]|uniref:ABC transporter ATP-binding protein n=1 Tax=Micromonospora sp. NPDC023814 TaxID=3154596 RepID=UPI003402F839